MFEREPEDRERKQHSREYGRFERLTQKEDWQLADDEPDIVGWPLVNPEGSRLANVDDLLFNSKTGEALFALVTYGGTLGINETKTLVPLQETIIDKANQNLVYRGSVDDIKNAPEYRDDLRDYGSFMDYWSGGERTAEMEERRRREIREERREQVVYPSPAQRPGEHTKVRVKKRMLETGREPEPDETVVHEGEVVKIPVVGERVVGEIVVTPNMTEEEIEEEEERTRRGRRA